MPCVFIGKIAIEGKNRSGCSIKRIDKLSIEANKAERLLDPQIKPAPRRN